MSTRRGRPPRQRRPLPPRPIRTDGPIPLYDVDVALAELARQRLKRDALTRGTVQLSDSLTEHLLRHLAPDETETAGRALLIAVASIASLVVEAQYLGDELAAEAALNIIAFAGGRMVTEGRAWTDAAPPGQEDR